MRPGIHRVRTCTAVVVCLAVTAGLALQMSTRSGGGEEGLTKHPRVAADPRTSCGPVSLAVVSHILGTPATIDEFNELTKVGPTGTTSMLDLKRALEAKGIGVAAKRFHPQNGLPSEGVMILHIRRSHFLVALPIDRERAIMIDLPGAITVSTRDALLQEWSGDALVACHPDPGGKPATANPAHVSDADTSWVYAGYWGTWYNHVVGPNAPAPDCNLHGAPPPGIPRSIVAGSGAFGATSNHPGGVNVLMMGGGTRFVADKIDLHLWRAIATRDGGEIVGQF